MADARFTTLPELRELMSVDVSSSQKINCIKLLRQITGEGLKETKDFFEQEWMPFVLEGQRFGKPTMTPPAQSLELVDIMDRLQALENIVSELTRNETKKMAATIFTE
ncbi:hypothetical protein [Silicibacter phage DSS3phi2]|uniref:Large ribosomal subunit protein bL12 C-terminal domain-containing protein n=1 Tax=Silicibacter phage DSS3phi2 TaxID=490912 RepID=C4NT09_9CAUD|nr:hypothetical protein DSS3P2_gp07 [Silicibacter phage DSS3phi2]ACL81275.1 hypothetical protein [Silicibacter phage DSS3phi2]